MTFDMPETAWSWATCGKRARTMTDARQELPTVVRIGGLGFPCLTYAEAMAGMAAEKLEEASLWDERYQDPSQEQKKSVEERIEMMPKMTKEEVQRAVDEALRNAFAARAYSFREVGSITTEGDGSTTLSDKEGQKFKITVSVSGGKSKQPRGKGRSSQRGS